MIRLNLVAGADYYGAGLAASSQQPSADRGDARTRKKVNTVALTLALTLEDLVPVDHFYAKSLCRGSATVGCL